MADSASESDSGSVDGGSLLMPPSPISRDQLQKRIESLSQHNRVLKVELDTYKLRVKGLLEENRSLKQASVNIQARAEQEEEYISNTLLKKIQALKKEKETLAINYEQEEECLTNDLSRRLNQLRHEKEHLEHTLEQEQECLVNKLMNKIQKLETETLTKQTTLEQLRREKVELENTLEQEQEALVNKLWKRMEKLEAEKRLLYVKLERPSDGEVTPPSTNSSTSSGAGGGGSATTTASAVSHANSIGNNSHSGGSAFANCNSGGGVSSGGPGGRAPPPPGLLLAMGRARRLLDPSSSSPGGSCASVGGPATAGDLSLYIQQLRREVNGLKTQLHSAQREHTEKMVQYAKEEQHIRQENQRLQRRLTQEMERRDSLCRHLSESESSLEMDEERQAAELALTGGALGVSTAGIGGALGCRSRTVSSPGPFSLPSPGGSRPISPGRDMMMCGPPSPGVARCYNCGAPQPPPRGRLSNHSLQQAPPSLQSAADKFVKPAAPSGIGIAMSPGRPMQMSPTPGRSSTPTEQVASPIGIPGSPMDTSRQ